MEWLVFIDGRPGGSIVRFYVIFRLLSFLRFNVSPQNKKVNRVSESRSIGRQSQGTSRYGVIIYYHHVPGSQSRSFSFRSNLLVFGCSVVLYLHKKICSTLLNLRLVTLLGSMSKSLWTMFVTPPFLWELRQGKTFMLFKVKLWANEWHDIQYIEHLLSRMRLPFVRQKQFVNNPRTKVHKNQFLHRDFRWS